MPWWKESGTQKNGLIMHGHGAFADIGIIFRELGCETPVFSRRAAPKNPNASYRGAEAFPLSKSLILSHDVEGCMEG